jgi:uracil-DNA glycosylase
VPCLALGQVKSVSLFAGEALAQMVDAHGRPFFDYLA